MYNQEQLKIILGTIDKVSGEGYDPSVVLEAMKVYELSGINESLGNIRKSIQNLNPDPDSPVAVELREIGKSLDYIAARIEEK